MAKNGTKLLKAFLATFSSPPAVTVAKNKQDKELNKDAGTFQKIEDKDDVTDSKGGSCVHLNDNHLCGEGQVVGKIVKQNADKQCENRIVAVVTKQKCLNHLLVTTLFSFMQLPFRVCIVL